MASEVLDVDCEGVSIVPLPEHVTLRQVTGVSYHGDPPYTVTVLSETQLSEAPPMSQLTISSEALPPTEDNLRRRVAQRYDVVRGDFDDEENDEDEEYADEEEDEEEDEYGEDFNFRPVPKRRFFLQVDRPQVDRGRALLRSRIIGSWKNHPHRDQIATAMRSCAPLPASEVEAWCARQGMPAVDLKWERSRRAQLSGSIAKMTTKKLERFVPFLERELRERSPARPFDAMVNGRSVYELDRLALEELAVVVDWHLSRRG
jgi:hypothetical protein